MKLPLIFILLSPALVFGQQKAADTVAGKKDYLKIPLMVKQALMQKNDSLANSLAHDYIDNYLLALPDSSLYVKAQLDFIRDHLSPPGTKAFTFFLKNEQQIDRAMHRDDYVKEAIKYIVSKTDIDPLFAKSAKNNIVPDWKQLLISLKKECPAALAREVLLDAQLRWYRFRKEWPAYCHYLVEKVDRYGTFGVINEPSFRLNAIAWDLFQHSSDTHDLKKALAWSEESVRINSSVAHLDTEANLLYKLGETKKAIAVEEQALGADPRSPLLKDTRETLEKMKTGLRTWPEL